MQQLQNLFTRWALYEGGCPALPQTDHPDWELSRPSKSLVRHHTLLLLFTFQSLLNPPTGNLLPVSYEISTFLQTCRVADDVNPIKLGRRSSSVFQAMTSHVEKYTTHSFLLFSWSSFLFEVARAFALVSFFSALSLHKRACFMSPLATG
jgi:hypothetical protein